jgi:glycine/D-amino acid oxidase-like deaminating enzyme
MVTFGSTSETSTEMRKYTRDLYARLEAETGLATGFKPVGFIEVAATATASRSTAASPPSTATAASTCTRSRPGGGELFPLARTDDILAGFYVKEDGRVNPVDVTMALAKGARMHGAKISRACPSPACQKGGAVAGVSTPYGDIEAEYVVNCAGMWARQLGAKSRCQHSAAGRPSTTTSSPTRSPARPQLAGARRPGSYGYFREEVGG